MSAGRHDPTLPEGITEAELWQGAANGADGADVPRAKMISALHQRFVELIEQNQHLDEAVAARDAFLAVAAHELRNPMTPIAGRVSGTPPHDRRRAY